MGDHAGLATGWDPGTPAADSIVRAFSLSMADPVLGERQGHRTRLTDAYGAVDVGVPAGFGNSATLLQPLPAHGWEALLDEIEAFFAGRPDGGGRPGPTGHVLLFSPWPTPDLRARGWHLHGHPPLMVRPPAPMPAWTRPPAPGLRIVPVADAAGLADFERTLVDAFPLADARDLVPGGLFGPALLDEPRWRFFVGYEDARPVATAAAFVDYGLVDVNFVSTRREGRGRGYGEAVTWAATMAGPGLPAALLASDDGRPVYERMGYLPILRFTLWGRDRA